MKEFEELSDRLAREVIRNESLRRKLGKILREIASEKISLKEILDEKIIIQINKAQLNSIKVAGVDGGLIKRSFHGVDIRLNRAVGVIFSYSNGKLERVDYHPSPLPPPIPNIIFDPYSELELELSSGMERQALEASIASEVIENFKPNLLLMHGSLIPHYIEKPSVQSIIYPTYTRLIERCKELFQTSVENNTLLAGIVEDSRGMRFCEILAEKILKKFNLGRDMEILLNKGRDTAILSYALEAGERTFAFSYSSDPGAHPILKDFEKFADSFFSFYLKTAKYDRPIRVDILSSKVEDVNKLSSILLALVGHSSYGMPSVLIEADQRARLTERDMEMFCRNLVSKIGNIPGILNLRREERPF